MIFNMQSGGVVPDRYLDAQTITPGTENIVIPAASYLKGAQTILGDPDLIPENIKNGVDIFGVKGTCPPNNGKYMWIKRKWVPAKTVKNPSITVTMGSSNGTTTLPISNASFDLTEIGDYKTFFKGFAYDSTLRFDIIDDKLVYYYASSGTREITLFNATSATKGSFSVQYKLYDSTPKTFTYSGTKTIYSDHAGDVVGFVVSDNASAYPKKGLHSDGYYYSSVAIEHITPSSNMDSSAQIPHSLGVIPSYVIMEAQGETLNIGMSNYVSDYFSKDGFSSYRRVNWSSNSGAYYTESGGTSSDLHENYFTLHIGGILKGGKKYRIITIA